MTNTRETLEARYQTLKTMYVQALAADANLVPAIGQAIDRIQEQLGELDKTVVCGLCAKDVVYGGISDENGDLYLTREQARQQTGSASCAAGNCCSGVRGLPATPELH